MTFKVIDIDENLNIVVVTDKCSIKGKIDKKVSINECIDIGCANILLEAECSFEVGAYCTFNADEKNTFLYKVDY